MTVTITNDSANVIAVFADMVNADPGEAVRRYARLCGRNCQPTEAEATDATCQAILNIRGPIQTDEPSFIEQRANASDFIQRVLAEIRSTGVNP